MPIKSQERFMNGESLCPDGYSNMRKDVPPLPMDTNSSAGKLPSMDSRQSHGVAAPGMWKN